MIGSTKPASYTALLRAIPDNQHIKVVAAEHSRKQLKAAAARVSARLGLSVAQAPVIDDQRNRVVLHNKAATAARATNGLASWAPTSPKWTLSCLKPKGCPRPAPSRTARRPCVAGSNFTSSTR